jgi:DmsE family decaheme c-type cytochrome
MVEEEKVSTCIPGRRRLRGPGFTTVMFVMVNILLLTILPYSPVYAQAPTKHPGSVYAPQFTKTGVKACLYCHDLQRMRLIMNTPHGNGENPHAPFAQKDCESCHGPGSLHSTRSRRGKGRPPMITYGVNANGEKAKTPFAKQTETCLDNCHNKTMGERPGMQWNGSSHARKWIDAEGQEREMSCANCHEIHREADPLKDKKVQAKICYECHEKTEAEHPRFEEKGINYDKLSCWDCHDVHQLIPSEDNKNASR